MRLLKTFYEDLLSFRVQILYMMYAFNLMVLWAIVFKGIDYKILAVSFASLTMIIGFYFQSKAKQAEKENTNPAEGDPPNDRNPDE